MGFNSPHNPLETLAVTLLLKFHQVIHATFQRRIWFIQNDHTTMDQGEVKRLCLPADGWCGIWAKTHSTHFELWSLWFASTSSQWMNMNDVYRKVDKDELRLHIKFGLIFGVERSVTHFGSVCVIPSNLPRFTAFHRHQSCAFVCRCGLWRRKRLTGRHESGQEPWTRPAYNTNGYIYGRTHAVLRMYV